MSNPTPPSFGQLVKERRKALDLTQDALAERVGCSVWTIRKIELGERRPSRQVATLLAGCLRLPAEQHEGFIRAARLGTREGTAPGPIAVPPGGEAPSRTGGRAEQTTPNNLPLQMTPLIGREAAVDGICEHLRRSDRRLLTLTGAPGMGKTRLAIDAGRRLLGDFAHGVRFVALSSVAEPDHVAPAIAAAVGMPEVRGATPPAALRGYLGGRELLLVLDNFEQVLDASALILDLLGACPGLKALVTSREALQIQGEQQVHVSGLGVPDLARLPPVAALESFPAIALFADRARAVKADFGLTELNATAVAEVCVRLEGVPLAIEVAAARVNLFSPQEMRSRLDNQLDLLRGELRHLPPKQRTLRGAIDWSYRLLSDEEQRLFARLGVFAGGCTLAAAEAVCNARGDIETGVADVLASLLNKSLLKRGENQYGESRFVMLELLREYSLERLLESGEEESIRTMHAEYYRALAEVADHEVRRAEQKLWRERVTHEHENVRGALRWLLSAGHTGLALRLGGSMRPFWNASSHYGEQRQWLEEALARADDAPAAVRAKALHTAGQLAEHEVDYESASARLEESLALYRQVEDATGVASVLTTLAFSAVLRGDIERAISLCGEGLPPGLDAESGKLLYVIGAALLWRGNFAQADEFSSRAAAYGRAQEDWEIAAAALNALGLAAHYQGEYGRAEALYAESLSAARQGGARQHEAHVTMNMAALALAQGDDVRAAGLVSESLRYFVETGDREAIAEGLENTAWLAGLRGQALSASRLYGAAEALRKASTQPLPAFARATYERAVATIREQVDSEAFARAWEEGRGMRAEEAAAYALGL